MHVINDIDDSRISLYKDLRFTPKSHTENRLFISEGLTAVRVLLESDITIQSILLEQSYIERLGSKLAERVNEKNIFVADKEILIEIVGFKLHQGIMALAEMPEEVSPTAMNGNIVILNGIINSENVGAIVRNCAAFGVNNLIFNKNTSHPFMRRAVRVSMGAVCHINHYESKDMRSDLIRLKEAGHSVVAIENKESAISIDEFTIRDDSVIIFGSEGNGIDENIMDICDFVIKIPMSSKIKSINVAATSAIVLSKMYNSVI